MPLPGWFTHAASFCVGAVTAAAGVMIQTSSVNSDYGGTASRIAAAKNDGDRATPVASSSRAAEQTAMLPSMPARLFRPNDNLAIAFDARTKNPLFVLERLTTATDDRSDSDGATSTPAAASRKNKRFREERTLLPYHRSRNAQYRRSGYDRGHLAPAADFSSSSDGDVNDTFALTNVSPQVPRFNRSTWLRLEEFARRVSTEEAQGGVSSTGSNIETWVVTGPLWLPSSIATDTSSGGDENSSFRYSYEGIGVPPSLVAVPTHFYKVLVVIEKRFEGGNQSMTSRDGDVSGRIGGDEAEMTLKKFAAFVLPNAEVKGGDHRMRLVDHMVRLTDLEAVSGLVFFPYLFGTHVDSNGACGIPLRKEIADALTDDIRFDAKELHDGNASSLVPVSNGEELSKRRRKKVKQMLRENSPIPFQHLCKKNNACYKLLHVQ